MPVLQNSSTINRHNHIESQIKSNNADWLCVQFFHDVQRFTCAFAIVDIDLWRIVIGTIFWLI